MRILAFVALLVTIPSSSAPQEPNHPGYPPTVLLASAAEEGGKVVIQMSRPGPVPPSDDATVKPGDRYTTEWVSLRKVTLDEKVRAFGVDGVPAERQAVLTALRKPQGVAVFMRSYANDPQTPPAFYRQLFRVGTLLLVVNAEDLYNPKP